MERVRGSGREEAKRKMWPSGLREVGMERVREGDEGVGGSYLQEQVSHWAHLER